jgi:hypothetical protein
LHLGEVHSQLLGLLPGGVSSVRLLLASSSLLGCLPHGLLPLLGRLPHSLLPLLGRLSSSVLHALRRLPNLIGDPAQSTSEAAALLLAAAGEPAYGVLHLVEGASATLLLAPSQTAGQAAHGVLHLLGGSSHGILGLASHLPYLICGLASHLSYLICGLSRCLLGLPDCLTCGVLHLLGRSLCGLHDLLLGILGGLIHRVFDVHVLSRPIDHILELQVGVGHLLDLGLRVSLGHLLSILLQLGAIILRLALDPAYRPPVEFLGVLDGLLLKILSLIGHFISNPSSIVASCEQLGLI